MKATDLFTSWLTCLIFSAFSISVKIALGPGQYEYVFLFALASSVLIMAVLAKEPK